MSLTRIKLKWKCGKQFIEMIPIEKIDFDSKPAEPYPELEKCFEDKKCRQKHLYLENIPLDLDIVDGLKVIEWPQKAILLIHKDNKYVVAEGKHRIKLLKNKGMKDKILAIVEYQCDN